MSAKATPLHPSWHGTCFRRLSHKVGISQTWKKRAEKFKTIIAKKALHIKMLRPQIFSQTSHQERRVANSTSAPKEVCGEERFDLLLPTNRREAPSAHTDAQGQQACIQSKAPMDTSTNLEIGSTPHLEFVRAGQLWADVSDSEEGAKQMRTLKLRGLPFSATVTDIKNFLGQHVQYVEDGSCIYIVHDRDGRSSGLAEIIFMTSTAAKKCQAEEHMQKMFVETVPPSANIVQERYIEVFLREDRLPFEHFRRQRSNVHRATLGIEEPFVANETVLLSDCTRYWESMKGCTSVLSAVGNALSMESRQYLCSQHLGLKHSLIG